MYHGIHRDLELWKAHSYSSASCCNVYIPPLERLKTPLKFLYYSIPLGTMENSAILYVFILCLISTQEKLELTNHAIRFGADGVSEAHDL